MNKLGLTQTKRQVFRNTASHLVSKRETGIATVRGLAIVALLPWMMWPMSC